MRWNRRFWTEGSGSFLLAILLALTVRWALVEAFVIPSGSMLPTLLIQDHIFVNKIHYGLRIPWTQKWLFRFGEPQRGEVIVFKFPENSEEDYIKRVVGIPGDQILYENGNLYINDQLVEKMVPGSLSDDVGWLNEAAFLRENPTGMDGFTHWEEQLGTARHSILLRKNQEGVRFGPYEVPPDHYFVMGDNRDKSSDSRFWTPTKRYVPREYLVGRAMFVWLSCEEKMQTIPFLCHPLKIRWRRIFHPVK